LGGSLFTLGGVIPLAWFITSRRKALKKVVVKIVEQPESSEKISETELA
jgi:hypothetical protein